MNISFYDVLFKLCVKENFLESLKEKGFLEETDESYKFTKEGLEKAGVKKELKIEGKKQKDEKTDSQAFVDLVNAMRDLFHKDNLGVIGKRSTFADTFPKLARFKQEYGYSDNIILGATKLYVDHIKKTHGFPRELHYFVYKRLEGAKDSEISDLAKWCEEFQEEKKPSVDFSRDH